MGVRKGSQQTWDENGKASGTGEKKAFLNSLTVEIDLGKWDIDGDLKYSKGGTAYINGVISREGYRKYAVSIVGDDAGKVADGELTHLTFSLINEKYNDVWRLKFVHYSPR